jgi:hypothetical protein
MPDGSLESRIGTPENIQAYEFLTDFMRAMKGPLPNFADTNLADRSIVFFGEAEIRDGRALPASEARPDDIDFVPIPTYDGRLATTPCWDNGWAIPVGASNPYGAAVLAELITMQYVYDFRANQEINMTQAQLDRYDLIMTQTVAQQRNFPGVAMLAGNGDARDGMPAASIVERFRAQVAEEVRLYNEIYLGR